MSDTTNHTSIVHPSDDKIIKNQKKSNRYFSIIYEFSSNTTAHGIPRISESVSKYNRLYWLFATLCFIGLMTYFIIKAIIDYLNYPTQIDISIDAEFPQHFPAFTICNAGGLRFDKFIQPFLNYTNTLNITNTNDTSTIFPEQIPYLFNFVNDLLNNNGSLEPFFFPLPSMLYSCTYNSVTCTATDFVPFIAAPYGFCYTFNAKLKNETSENIRNVSDNGGTGTLELAFYVHSHQYIPYLTDSVGIVTLIHDNTEVPVIDTTGLNLIPRQKHKLSYKKKKTSFLQSPYTSCNDKIDLWMQAMYENYPNLDYQYSQTLCTKLSVQIYTYEKCGCVNPYIWDMRSIILPHTKKTIFAPFCNTTDPCFNKAVELYINSLADLNNDDLNCPAECSIVDFITKKSSLLTPMPWQLYGIKTFVENSLIPLPSDWSTTWSEYIYTNYVAVSVVQGTYFVESNIQQASINLIDVLSNIGGQTGLWLGISLLSIMELFEMFYRLIRLAIRKKKQRITS
ncbi:unnamed protein product [Adineta steineri]|uniref:Uncharacterized protein n=1 Tax=Adineta steineri TaxID=433720 RepID=A0A814JKN5_9BILA|nr:unnamed protein product [Adineta steineri]CAF1102597.1 unnamed protein product [Adineta steineri]